MRMFIIKDGFVENVVVASDINALPGLVPAVDGVGIGWRYENGQFVAPEEQQPSQAEIIAELDQSVVDWLTETARARGYGDNNGMHPLLSIATYDNDPNPRYAADADAFKRHRSAVWTRCYEIQNECLAGARPIPTKAELLAMLPALVWPE